jgi:hypothetical protein
MTLGGTLIITVALGLKGRHWWPQETDHGERRGRPHEQMV